MLSLESFLMIYKNYVWTNVILWWSITLCLCQLVDYAVLICIKHCKDLEFSQNCNIGTLILKDFPPPQIWAPSSRTSLPCCFRTPRTLQGRRASARSGSGWRSTPRSASVPPSLSSSFSSLSSTSPTARSSWRAPWMWWWICLTDKLLTNFPPLHFYDELYVQSKIGRESGHHVIDRETSN